MTHAPNPDVKNIAFISVVQFGIVVSIVLLATAWRKFMAVDMGMPQELLFVSNWGLVFGLIPMLWSVIAAYLCGSRRTSARARTATFITGIGICTALTLYLVRALILCLHDWPMDNTVW